MIVLCAGGTGGHVFPAEGLAASLKKRGYKLALITDKRAMNFVNYECFDAIQVVNVRRTNFLIYILTMIECVLKSLWFLYRKKAKIVVGFGGYPSLPGMIAAKLLFKRILIHEQNSVLGRANRFLQNFSKGLATSFYVTKHAPHSAVWIGNPVRESVQVVMQTIPVKNPELFNLCVVGGSQGAKLFSEIVPKAIELLPKEYHSKLRITQQCRIEQLLHVEEFYKKLGIEATLENFFSDMPTRLSQADLAICRSGASTIAELTCLGVPAIFVPLAISKDNDQGENAQAVVKAGGAWMFKERELTPQKLAALLKTVIENREILNTMSQAMQSIAKPHAAEDLANWLETFL